MNSAAKFLFGVAITAIFVTPARAESPPANDRILQQELKQQQLRTTTQRVGDQLEAIIAEFDGRLASHVTAARPALRPTRGDDGVPCVTPTNLVRHRRVRKS